MGVLHCRKIEGILVQVLGVEYWILENLWVDRYIGDVLYLGMMGMLGGSRL